MPSSVENPKLLHPIIRKIKEVVKTVASTSLGRGLLRGSIATILGFTSDSVLNWQSQILTGQPDYVVQATEPSYLNPAPDLDVFDDTDVISTPQITAADSIEIPRGNGKMTLIDGAGNDPKTSINVVMLLYPDTSLNTARQLSEGLYLPKPMDKYKDRFRVWAAYLTQDPKCDFINVRRGCDMEVIKSEIGITKAAGIVQHLSVVVKAMENRAAGVARLTSPLEPPKIDNAYALLITPPTPRFVDKLALAHEVLGHLLNKLADARLITDSSPDVGIGYFNCSRNPAFWDWAPTQWRGCESDPLAYINNAGDIMEGSFDDFAPENWAYIDRVMQGLPSAFGEPYGIKLLGDNFSLLQSVNNEPPVYQTKGLEFILAPAPADDSTCIEIKVMPAPNIYSGIPDGPAYHNIFCGELIFQFGEVGLKFPKPEMGVGNYFQLPGMTYSGEARIIKLPPNATESPKPDDPRWNRFKNPYTGQEYIRPTEKVKMVLPYRFSNGTVSVYPKMNETVTVKRPKLQWDNKDKDVFYYEVQASKDCSFNTDPQTATAAVWQNLVHGGMTQPLNSWQTPDLEPNTEYCWRNRPRIQGDGIPVDWSQTFRFKTDRQLVQGDPSANPNSLTITLVQEVEGPGGVKEMVSYPHIIPLDNEAVLPKKEELIPDA